MCIIVAKPEGVEFPPLETLEQCFYTNPDGAGFMFSRDKKVHIRKGFMDFESFMVELASCEIDMQEACVMHFRIGTQGGNTPQNCHPFPVPCDEESMKELSVETTIGMVHNGIISLCSSSKSKVSDTMIYAQDIVSPLARIAPTFMQNDDALELLESTCKSKLCFLNGLGDIVTVGEFIEDDGVLYSNTSYLNYRYGFSTYKTAWEYEPEYFDDLYEACQYCYMLDECECEGPLCLSDDEAMSRINYADQIELQEEREKLLL